jgi:hypothetical protein
VPIMVGFETGEKPDRVTRYKRSWFGRGRINEAYNCLVWMSSAGKV